MKVGLNQHFLNARLAFNFVLKLKIRLLSVEHDSPITVGPIRVRDLLNRRRAMMTIIDMP